MSDESRRKFLFRLSSIMAGSLALQGMPACTPGSSDRFGELLPQRSLGNTGQKISMLGIGGFHIGQMPENQCPEMIDKAIELGIRLFDTAAGYQKGGSEERYGKYLCPRYRSEIFLLSKTTARDAATARKHLEGSLRRLNTTYLDLWKMHSVNSPEDVDGRLEMKVLDEMIKAKEEGKVRHIGFSGHRTFRANNHLIGQQDEFQTCLLPVNVADPSFESFITNTFPFLREKDYGIMAMKTLAGGGLLGERGETGSSDPDRPRVIPSRLSVEQALHFTWSLPVSTIISGMSNVQELEQNVASLHHFHGMGGDEREALVEKVADLAVSGKMEWYKKTD